MKEIWKYCLLWVLLIFVQLSIFDNLNILGRIDSYIVLILLILMPTNSFTYKTCNAFLIGIIIDIFQGTGGVHTLGMLIGVLIVDLTYRKIIIPKKYLKDNFSFKQLRVVDKVILISFLSLGYCTSILLLDRFTFSNILKLSKDIILSTVFTISLIYLTVPLLFKNTKSIR